MAFITKTKQGRKQRLRAYIAPNHVRRKRLNAPLSKELRKKSGKRSVLVHKGDEVMVLAGKFRKTKAKISKVDIHNSKIFLEGVARKTIKGREVPVAFPASTVVILTLAERKKKSGLQKPAKVVKAAPVQAKPVAAPVAVASK